MARIVGTAENDELIGTEAADQIFGLGGDDDLFGLAGDDELSGGDGDDYLDGGAGFNVLRGGAGNDNLNLGEGTAPDLVPGARLFGEAGHDFLEAAGLGDLFGDGGDGDDAINLSALDDATAVGGAGNDAFHIEAAEVVAHGDAGRDTLLVLSTRSALATGGTGPDSIVATHQFAPDGSYDPTSRVIEGGSGHDELGLLGLAGVVRGNDGSDVLWGSANDLFGDRLEGGAGDDILQAQEGTDVLVGGAGRDVLVGGEGRDRFVLGPGDSGIGAAARDIILDMSRGEGDLINLGAIDANAGRAGNQAFAFIGERAFSAAGQVRFVDQGASVLVQWSTDGDRAPEGEIEAFGVQGALTGLDFVL